MEKQSTKERINEKISEIEKFTDELFEFMPREMQIVNYKRLKYPEYEKEIFDILHENKIISENLAKKLKDAKGMRNIIAYQYGKIDDELVFEAITEQLEKDVSEFLIMIEKAIK